MDELSEIPEGLVLREILTFEPGQGEFRKEDYPWLVAVQVHVKGDASFGDFHGDGEGPGHIIIELYGPPVDPEAA